MSSPSGANRPTLYNDDLPPKNWFSYYVRTGIEKSVIEMARRSYRPKRIISKLREVEALLGQGSTIDEAARKTRVTGQTYCR